MLNERLVLSDFRVLDRLIDWSFDRSIDRSIDWSIDRLIDRLIVWLIDWLIDWLVGWLIDWLIDWRSTSNNKRIFLSLSSKQDFYTKITLLTWVSFRLFLAPSKATDESFTALILTRASHVKFVAFLAVKHVTIHSFLAGFLLRTLGLIVSRSYHLQTCSEY